MAVRIPHENATGSSGGSGRSLYSLLIFILGSLLLYTNRTLLSKKNSHGIAPKNVDAHTITIQEHLDAKENPRSGPENAQNKPKLMLHVGPMKTGTTTLQATLNTKANHKILSQDNVAVVPEHVNFRYMGRLINNCISRPINETHCNSMQLWDNFVRVLKESAGNSASTNETKVFSVINSCETYSKIPDNPFAIRQFRSLQEYFDVTVITFYRRPAGWFSSLHTQLLKPDIWRNAGGFLEFTDRPDRNLVNRTLNPSIPSHQIMRDTLGTIQFYGKVFGTTNVKVLDYHADHLELEFFCSIGITPIFCAHVSKIAAGKTLTKRLNDNTFLLTDEDLLATHAYNDGYFHPKDGFVSRNQADKIIKNYFDVFGRDILPKRCLNSTDVDWLWNRTLWLEDNIAPHPMLNKTALRDDFDKYVERFCEVDAPTMLQTEYWKEQLRSSDFVKPKN
eukprot:CAMPEP_0194363698 /NCGR_PEP_ID=MMETSP0174-20130528/11552_1 /TAXON_ID=216777 /ORGANISM="Proboscia alata, Strain PI-D3" /LENGTH=448 /DNA_ID=CAMNT_0039137293 /DNA_START=106 /DNA_END=1452 /DNA_ORIENTATION=+